MTSIHQESTRVPDNPVITEIPTSPSLQRIRHVPDWEIPVNPPKRPFLTREHVSRSWRRSRLAAALKPRPRPGSRSGALGPASVDSLPKETVDDYLLPTHRRPSFQSFPTPPATPGGSLSARCRARVVALFPRDRKCCGLTRLRLILLLIFLILAIIALALGLGLGLGLKKKNPARQLPLPDDGDSARVYEGDLTFFSPALGACGWVSADADYICAVGHELFDAAGANANAGGNPNLNPLCGRMIRVSREYFDDVGHPNVSVDVMVVDRCTGCEPTDLDLAPSAFNRLAPETRGRVVGRWEWLPVGKQ